MAKALEAAIIGFGYPFDDITISILGRFFQLPTLMGFALQSFAHCLKPMKSFDSNLSALALFRKTRRLYAGAPASSSSGNAVPLFATQRVRSGRDPVALLSFSDLSGTLHQ